MGVNEENTNVKKLLKPPSGNGRRLFVSVIQHPVADAQLGVDILGFGGVFPQFAADVGHVDAQDLVAVVAAAT